MLNFIADYVLDFNSLDFKIYQNKINPNKNYSV